MRPGPVRSFLLFMAIPMILVGLVMLCPSCSRKKKISCEVLYDTNGLRNGDLMFRNGHGYESRVVTDLSSGCYSHIGIAYHDGIRWCVIHAVPGEVEKGEKEFLKCEAIGDFFRPDRAKAGAYARVECSDSVAETAAKHALMCVRRNVLFDNQYDLDDTSSLYCTELVRLVYSGCGIDLCEDRWHRAPLFTKKPVIYPEDIWHSPLLSIKKPFETSR